MRFKLENDTENRKDRGCVKRINASLVSAFDLDGLDSIISHNLENDKTQYLKKIARALYSKSIIVLASFLVCMSLIGLANSEIDSRVWFLVVSLAAAFSLFTISILRIKTPQLASPKA